jgi:hypothetical protein
MTWTGGLLTSVTGVAQAEGTLPSRRADQCSFEEANIGRASSAHVLEADEDLPLSAELALGVRLNSSGPPGGEDGSREMQTTNAANWAERHSMLEASSTPAERARRDAAVRNRRRRAEPSSSRLNDQVRGLLRLAG